jgi:hypothetical protein
VADVFLPADDVAAGLAAQPAAWVRDPRGTRVVVRRGNDEHRLEMVDLGALHVGTDLATGDPLTAMAVEALRWLARRHRRKIQPTWRLSGPIVEHAVTLDVAVATRSGQPRRPWGRALVGGQLGLYGDLQLFDACDAFVMVVTNESGFPIALAYISDAARAASLHPEIVALWQLFCNRCWKWATWDLLRAHSALAAAPSTPAAGKPR